MLDINSPQYLKGKLGEDFVAEWFQKNRSASEVVRHPFPFKSGAATWDFLKTDDAEMRILIEVKTYKNYWDSLNKVDFFFMKRKDIVLYYKDYRARRKTDDIDGALVFFVCAELKTVFLVDIENLFKKKIIQCGCIFKTMRDEEGNILWQIPIPNLERVTKIPNELCEKILAIEISPQKVYDSDDNSDIEEEDWDDDEDEEEDWDDEDTEDAKETEEKILDKTNEISGGQEKPNPPEEKIPSEKHKVDFYDADYIVESLVEFNKFFNPIVKIPRETVLKFFFKKRVKEFEWSMSDCEVCVPLNYAISLYETSGEQTDSLTFNVSFEFMKKIAKRDILSLSLSFSWEQFIKLKFMQSLVQIKNGVQKTSEGKIAKPKCYSKFQANILVEGLVDFEKTFKSYNIPLEKILDFLVNSNQHSLFYVDVKASHVFGLTIAELIEVKEKNNDKSFVCLDVSTLKCLVEEKECGLNVGLCEYINAKMADASDEKSN